MSFQIINLILQPHTPGVNELMMLGYKNSCLAAGPAKEGDMFPTKMIISTIPFLSWTEWLWFKIQTLFIP